MLERFPVQATDFAGPVLITGAGGCIGSWAMALLVRAGVPVVVYDLNRDQRRPRLLLEEAELERVTWVTGDIADTEAVSAVVTEHGIQAVIHLAALQVPFCKADPVAGANANVLGTVNVLEAARHTGLQRVAYASSIAAVSFLPDAAWLETLYGAYKLCNEMTARVYMQDWGVPSVGIRPGVVYGVARDQGLTSKTTVAILAAAAGKPYAVPFTGPVSALHAGEVASAFIRAVSQDRDEAKVFDLNGRATSVVEWLDILQEISPGAAITMAGTELPFPSDLSDAPIQHYLGDYGQVPLQEGMCET
ncbi:MAG: NAD(P)-dependent oxidoreductase, partial [Gammaproteobacteria bacterium]|nr:NAD(P)-dependent oxidoreductase [Gammaproteobacteria bacterium]